MIAGALEIQLSAGVARLQADMAQAKGIVSSASADMQRSVAQLKSVFATLGLGLGVAGLARLVSGSLEAQDALAKLSQKVNVSVEGLVGLQHAAQLSGISMEAVAKGLKSISTQAFDASRGLAESQRNFASLGIDVRTATGVLKTSEQLTLEVADAFAKMGNTTERTALAVKLFGKAGLDMIPMLSDGAAGLRAMMEEGRRLNPVTAESARQAEVFNDNLLRLEKTVGAVGVRFVNSFLPALSELSTIFAEDALSGDVKKATNEVSLFAEAIKAVIVVGGNVSFVLKTIGKELGGMAAQLAAMLVGDFSRVQTIGEMMMVDAIKARQEFDAWEKKILAAGTTAAAAAPKIQGAAKAILDVGKAAKDAEKWRYEMAKAEQDAAEMFAKDYAEAWKFADEQRNKEAKKAADEREVIARAEQDAQEMFAQDYYEAWRYANEYIRKEDEKRIAEATQQWGGFIGGIEGAFRDAWNHIGDSWSSALDVMKSAFKRIFLDFIYQSLAKPFVMNLIVSLSSAAGLGGLTTAATAAGGASGGLGILGSLGSLLPGGAIGTAFGNIANMGASLLGAGGALASAIGGIASFVPVIGAAIGIVTMLHSMFDDGPENQNFRWMQGTGGPGAFGGVTTAGNFPLETSALLTYINNLDQRFISLLGPGGTSSASARLAAYTGTGLRMDGTQPAEFGMSPGDETAAEHLAMELLQSRYSVLFDEVDRALGDAVRNWEGDATSLQGFIETALTFIESLGELMSVADIIEAASRTSADVFAEQGRQLRELAANSTLTTASLAQLTQATNAYRTSAVQLILELENASREIDAMFGATARTIQLAGLDDQGQFDFYQAEAARLFGELGTASSAADIQRITALINQDINSAFGMLTPEQQRSMQSEWLDRLNNVNQTAQERIAELQRQAAADANDTLTRIESLLEDSANRQSAAADQIANGGADILTAARTPQTLTIKLDLVTGTATVNGG